MVAHGESRWRWIGIIIKRDVFLGCVKFICDSLLIMKNVCKTCFFFYKNRMFFTVLCWCSIITRKTTGLILPKSKDDENVNSLPFMCWIEYLLFCAETNIYFFKPTHIIFLFINISFLFYQIPKNKQNVFAKTN